MLHGPWLNRVVIRPLPQSTRFDRRPIHVGFVVNALTLGQPLRFSPLSIIPLTEYAHISFVYHGRFTTFAIDNTSLCRILRCIRLQTVHIVSLQVLALLQCERSNWTVKQHINSGMFNKSKLQENKRTKFFKNKLINFIVFSV